MQVPELQVRLILEAIGYGRPFFTLDARGSGQNGNRLHASYAAISLGRPLR